MVNTITPIIATIMITQHNEQKQIKQNEKPKKVEATFKSTFNKEKQKKR